MPAVLSQAAAYAQPVLERPSVTTRKHREPTTRTPLTAAVFDQTELDYRGVEGVEQLQLYVPSLVASDASPRFALRGVGGGPVGPGAEAGFSIHYNGVYASRVALIDNVLFDIERIEVMRGPQGVLYGRNTNGGNINVLPRSPSPVFEASLDYEYGSYDTSRARGVLNAPIANLDAAARIAILFNHRRGYYDQLFTDPKQRSFDRNDLAVRASLSWQPLDRVDADLSWTFIHEDGDGRDHKLLGDPLVSGTTGIGLDDFGRRGAGNGGNAALPSPPSVRRGNENRRQILDGSIHFGTLTLSWETGDLTLKSITGYQSNARFNSFDGDHTELDIRSTSIEDDLRSWSTELNLLFDDGGPFELIFGNSYFDEKVESSGGERLRIQQTNAVRPFVPEINARAGEIAAGDPNSPFLPFPDDFEDRLHLSADATNRTFAAFGEIGYRVRENWRIQAGLRYSYTDRVFDDRSHNADQAFADDFLSGRLPFYAEENGSKASETWDAWTWRIATDLELNADNFVYASLSTGNRPGGFDFLSAEPFRAEDLLAFEIGSNSELFEDRLRLSTSAFYYDYEDIQVEVFSATADRNRTTNVPSAEIYGVELGWLAAPLRALVIDGSLSWLDTRIDEDFSAVAIAPCRSGAGDAKACPDGIDAPVGSYRVSAQSENLKGNRLPRAPEFALHVGAQYSLDLARWDAVAEPFDGVVTARFDYSFRDEIFFDVFNRDAFRQGSFDSGHLRIIFDRDFGAWAFRIEGYARNLWDEEFLVDVVPSSGGLQRVGFYNEPRKFGFRISGRWR